MSFFRKNPVADEKPKASETLKSLTARKDQELRALGEIYYESVRRGRVDARALGRKVKEIEALDERAAALSASKKPAAPPAHAGDSGRQKTPPCETCGAGLGPTDRFCVRCGTPAPQQRPLGRPCPVCNRGAEEGARFCNHCGASMTTAGRIRIRHPLTGQEANFDFQPAPSHPPHATSYELEPAEDIPGDFDPADPGPDDPEKSWIRELERFARPSHGDVQMFVNRGKELMQSGRYREAAVEFEGAILQNARDGRSHYYLGVARYKSGDLDSAIDAFQRCIRLDRSNSDAHNDLGLCYARKGERRESLEHYKHALRLNPAHSDAHYNVAHLYMQQMVYPEAIRHLQLYLQHSPRALDHKKVHEMIEKLHAAISSGSTGLDFVLPQH